jgi:L-asparaginase II
MADRDDRRGTPASQSELAVVVRSGFVESRHVGHAVVTAPDGRVVVSLGRPDRPVYARSTLKPWQAVASRSAGAEIDGPSLAIAAGSHAGERRHRDLVAAILDRAGLGPGALSCPADMPMDDEAYDDLVRAGDGPTPLAMNCSGKHAAMLAACAASGWDTGSYLDPGHPVQCRVRDVVEDRLGETVAHVGVDGCGAPVFAVTLTALARAVGALARDGSPDAVVAEAMRAHPWAVAGTGRADTRVMELLPGVVAKIGAEGLQILGTSRGVGIAVKVLDGSSRTTMLVALRLLATQGHDVAAALEAAVPPVLGGGTPVGAIVPGADLGGL